MFTRRFWRVPNEARLNSMWSEFCNGQLQRFHIRFLDEDWRIPYIELVLEVLRNDPMIKAMGFSTDPVSLNSLRAWIDVYLSQNIVTGCFLKRDYESDVLVAVDILYVHNYRDEYPNPNSVEGDAFRKLMRYIRLVERSLRYPEAANICNFLTSFGIFTRRDYRQCCIEENMIRTRKRIAKEYLRIEYVGSAFMGPGLEAAARKNNYKVIKVLNPVNLLDSGILMNISEMLPINIMRVKYKNGERESY